MIDTTDLRTAISKVFDIKLKDVPEFTSSKPVNQAKDWLERNDHEFNYHKAELKAGIVIFAFGSSNPMITIVEKDDDEINGAIVFGTLSAVKKRKSKSQKRREKVVEESQEDSAVEAPIETEDNSTDESE